MIDCAGPRYTQIDAGRIGGISAARDVATYARQRSVPYVNHAFTSHLTLSVSLQVGADAAAGAVCQYPVEPKPLAIAITRDHLEREGDGMIRLPERPGLSMEIDVAAARTLLVDVDINVRGKRLYRTPDSRD